MTTTPDAARVHDGLRAWAKGLYPLEAATELLIRGGFAQASQPWVKPCDTDWPDREHWHWIDFAAIPDHVGTASGGERRFLLFAASLSDVVDLGEQRIGDLVSGVDRSKVDLILAAIAHAAGTHEHSVMRSVTVQGSQGPFVARMPDPSAGYAPPLHPWPAVGGGVDA